MLITLLSYRYLVQHMPAVGISIFIIEGFLDFVLFASYLNWLGTKAYLPTNIPVLSYKSFQRIEQIAPDKWQPSGSFVYVLYYNRSKCNTTVDDWAKIRDWDKIRMRTYLDAVRLYFGYTIPYRRRKKMEKRNSTMEYYLELWKADVECYKRNNRTYVDLVNHVLGNAETKASDFAAVRGTAPDNENGRATEVDI